jgi:hypothetical protein
MLGVVSRRWPLLALACAPPMLETIALRATGQLSSLGMAPHVTAPAPLGLFHDLRWTLVFHSSWRGYALEMVALLVFRTALTSALVLAAWPAEEPRPPAGRAVRTALLYVVIGSLVLGFPNALLFVEAVTPLSWIFLAGIAVLLLLALGFHQAAIIPHWWHRLPCWGAIGWVVLSFLVLSLDSVVISLAPAGVDVLVAGAGGVFNALTWYGLVVEVTRQRKPHGHGFVQGALAGFAGLLVVWGLAFYVVARGDAGALHSLAASAKPDPQRPIIGVSGFRSHWLDQADEDKAFGYLESYDFQPFSYAGLDAKGNPRPYGPEATYLSLEDSDALLAKQVGALHTRTGRPVTLVAASEGSLVAMRYLLTTPNAPVDELILLSPILEPGRVYYPPGGQPGWGRAAYWQAQSATRLVSLLMFPVSPDTPFIRSVAANARLLRPGMSCALPNVDERVFLPLASAVDLFPNKRSAPITVIPGFHGDLYERGAVRDAILIALNGGHLPRFQAWSVADDVIRRAASGWQEPELPLAFFPSSQPPAGGC